ncbi:MAG: RsmD family RNA methyltransferase [Gemmataceae bacterium]|nr:RsmD family RNA methyltransferase [Gemmataceae bacterium]
MRVQIRIVAGELRGRKLTCDISPDLRPTPQRVREALFSILGNAVPDRPFYDVFAGTGVVGLEALSRGASSAEFIERDFRLGQDIERHLKTFDYGDLARVRRADTYRWAEHWEPPAEPVNVFLSPPFSDLERRPEELLAVIRTLQAKLAPGSVLVLQAEESDLLDKLPDPEHWDRRRYGRNHLLFWGGATEENDE